MKKLTAILLALLLACGTMIGCDKETPQNEPAGKETTEQGSKETSPSETEPQMDDVIKDYDQDDSQQGFAIYGKKYYYKGYPALDEASGYTAGDVLILDVKNTTETNYTAAVTVTLFDETGNAIKTETKEFEQFIAGYQTCFLFNSKESFASYTCGLSLTEYTDEVIVDKISYEFVGYQTVDSNGAAMGGQKTANQMDAKIKLTKPSTVPTFYGSATLVIFDSTGEICLVYNRGARYVAGATESFKSVFLNLKDEDGTVTAEEFENEYSYMLFPREVTLGLWSKTDPRYERAKAESGK